MAKLKLEFDGFEEVVNRLKKLDGDVKDITEKALEASRDYVVPNLHSAMAPHRRTGKTEGAIDEKSRVEWTGTLAKISVGFDLKHGGLPSIFLMYGTPKMKKDQKLYNAIYGTATQNKIKQIQEDIFYDEIRRLGG